MLAVVLNSFLLVAATEMGDKTQLLAFVLATRFKTPWPILAGILAATVLNHWLAAAAGSVVAVWIGPVAMKWILAASFFGFALWVLVPDKDESGDIHNRYGAFMTTLVLFFIAEMGDKTQLSTVALAAKYHDVLWVTVGTTLGMLFADGLAVFFGERLTTRVPMRWVRWFSAALFVAFGVGLLLR